MLYGYEICWMNEFYEPAVRDTESGFVGAESYDDAVKRITDYYCKFGDEMRDDLIVSLRVWDEGDLITSTLIVDGIKDGTYALAMQEREETLLALCGKKNGGRG